jgi:hypothetical protein
LCYSLGALQDLQFYRFKVWETTEMGEREKHSTQTGMAMLCITAFSWDETREELYSAHEAHLKTPNGVLGDIGRGDVRKGELPGCPIV